MRVYWKIHVMTSNQKLFRHMCNQTQMAGKAFDIRLTVSEWLELVELVCEMCGVDNVERVLPVRLRGRALSVNRRLTCDQQVKEALLEAFGPDLFVAFDTFVLHHLCPGEYLGDLQDLACLIKENTSDWWLSCAFVSGLPGPVRWQLRESSRLGHITLERILARAWALMMEEVEVNEPVATAAGRCWDLPHVSLAHLQPLTNRMQVQCSATSVEVPITLSEIVGSPGANHEERSRRYAVIIANNKDMSHRGVRKTRQEARGRHYSLPT